MHNVDILNCLSVDHQCDRQIDRSVKDIVGNSTIPTKNKETKQHMHVK